MLKSLGKIIGLSILLLAGSTGLWFYQDRFSSERKIAQLEEQKQILEQVVVRLTDEKRVAEVLVTDQKTVDGVLETALLFVEYDKSGKTLPPKSFVIKGRQAHIDAMVIKFDRHFVAEGDPLRGHSIALFTRLYGDHQSPNDAFQIDQPGTIPAVYQGADPRVSEFELKLWKDFWRLADDASYRDKMGVRIANGQGVWGPFDPDKLYAITLESDGGLDLKSEPLKGIYREALRRKSILPTTGPTAPEL